MRFIYVKVNLGESRSQVRQALAERIFQYSVGLMMRTVEWESKFRQGKLCISGLRFELQEVSETLAILHDVISSADSGPSCCICDSIAEMESKYSYIKRARDLCSGLKKASFEPIGRILIDILLQGDASSDTFHELFVRVDTEEGITIERHRGVPSGLVEFLPVIEEIGSSSIHLRKLGVNLKTRMSGYLIELDKDPTKLLHRDFAKLVFEDIRMTVNKALWESIDIGKSVTETLEIIKKFFFITESDWFLNLLDSVQSELEKPVKSLNKIRVNDCLRSVSTNTLSATYHCFGVDQLSTSHEEDPNMLGVRAFTLHFPVPYPLNLIMSESIMFKAQTIFRHLSFCKYVELKLSDIWIQFQTLKSIDSSGCMLACNILLQKMVHFVKNYMFFLSVDVIQTKSLLAVVPESTQHAQKALEDSLSMIIHEFHLDTPIYRSVNKLFSTCGLFSAHMQRFIQLHVSGFETTEERMELLSSVTSLEKFTAMVQKFEDAFRGQTNSLLIQLRENGRVIRTSNNLLSRLDFNQYYSYQIAL
jgi:hypothetical protein